VAPPRTGARTGVERPPARRTRAVPSPRRRRRHSHWPRSVNPAGWCHRAAGPLCAVRAGWGGKLARGMQATWAGDCVSSRSSAGVRCLSWAGVASSDGSEGGTGSPAVSGGCGNPPGLACGRPWPHHGHRLPRAGFV